MDKAASRKVGAVERFEVEFRYLRLLRVPSRAPQRRCSYDFSVASSF